MWTGTTDAEANGVAIAANGSIVAAGRNGIGNGVGVVLAFASTGGLDATFSPSMNPEPGVTQFTTPAVFNDIVLRSDGKFYLAHSNADLEVMLLDAAGATDDSFGTLGVATVGSTEIDITRSLALDPVDDGVYAGGFSTPGAPQTERRFVMAKFNSDGTPDTGFGVAGVAWEQVGGLINSEISDLAAFPGGVVAVGKADDLGNLQEGFVARLNEDGSRDNTFFDATGTRHFGILGSTTYRFNAVAIKDDECDRRIVVVGSRNNHPTNSNGIVVVKLWD
jgi:uncharacterized delta-60 repeat protein